MASMRELASLQGNLATVTDRMRKKYASFDHAFSSYVGQYGDNAIKVHEPFKISDTIDPVVVILGRTTPLFYRDSKRLLTGSLGSVNVENGNVYILGRREPPDSKLIVWSHDAEHEVEEYDSRVRILPSRIHAAVFGGENGEVLFADLGSSSGSILAGESQKPEPFITLYATPNAEVHKVTINAKYSRSWNR
jgi:hypothetical protein